MIENFEFGRLVVIGDLLLDQYVFGAVERISPEAPVPVLRKARQSAVPGGAANVAVNAAALGCTVSLIGVVGQDENAQTLRNALAAWPGIDVHGLVAEPGWATISKMRVVSGHQQIVRIDDETIIDFSPATRNSLIAHCIAALDTADVLICSDYAKGVLSEPVLQAVIGHARAKNIPVIVDPKRKTFAAYRGASLITPNRAEMAVATGLPLHTNAEVEHAAQAASVQFGGDVLITRSEEGMTLWQRNGHIRHQVARKSEVYDVSGAGDAVVATIGSVLSAGQDLDTAIVIATVAASIAVSKLGTAAVTRAELAEELKEDNPDTGLIATWPQACAVMRRWHQHGASVVFTNGCFDLLHPGHVSLLHAAAQLGDKLVVAINSDASVRRLKGPTRPVQDEMARATVIRALRDVDMVVIFEEDTPLELITALQPDVLVKGADYTEDTVVGADVVKAAGGRVELVSLVAGCSTSNLVRKMNAPHAKPSNV
ncbi:MAG: D-glycero-beta-D-manno-heptose-7-phosphate kinase [Acetobacter fabarum]|jgi:D-beta-D-heptose 7-phosphate kinase/D-beta-D-heptose 1-phosphate adenosyltransferase|uniref:D-glycero-beta-D-manno-heptose-7-phosphate kinase n=1 Tax=Acetobacter fabarum TaxID=483199 RepID=UPI00242F4A59|nr:D-glycero-beta-D-manno-heptose-7-phosphate kinase [Acetobacter fabarum]MCH4025191.1 D-glycero-beta-D-manno-heptose-7-phosphate kinase [Acetobacter fabarum]MCH4055160.1 D-glycero-beta-D-manno-heptose-7-phosphate kinase [Acetobacter fabarum]MCH4128649.1 D-glycero-beta-D-manno-heptose-7-phosphate kinase [Acetobacter fabarum]MCH4141846.1 D-glycero-beta-D-manno-heptose-7-phosphate kinase [Acetobacter fabarum]MCI1297695.1 D-glycero-beta-D-manno-heptose-7-phosphate kinase [Acetobacter fabarum]